MKKKSLKIHISTYTLYIYIFQMKSEIHQKSNTSRPSEVHFMNQEIKDGSILGNLTI